MTEKDIFLVAVDIADPEGRAEYVECACAGDEALRREVEALLDSHASAETFLGKPAARLPNLEEAFPLGDTQLLLGAKASGSVGRIDHYEILGKVGAGGMGVVFKAMDTSLRRVVALKVLTPSVAASGAARLRFVREAQAAAAVTHENVIAIHAVEGDKPIAYLVMQFVSGVSLDDKIKANGPLPPREVLRVGVQIARGLAAAHAQGLIHRDIKPANILLENGVERVKITDFGLARAVDDASLTQSGVIAGTPMYMAPEQARGESVDQRADLFSLGSVLYTMAAGRPPFRASGTMAVLKRVCEDVPRPIREVNPDTPPEVCAAIDRLMAKEPSRRYQTAGEAANDLEALLAHLQHPTTTPAPARPTVPRRSRRLAGATLACLLSACAAVYLAWPRQASSDDPLRLEPIRPTASGPPQLRMPRVVAVSLDLKRDRIPAELLPADASAELVAVLTDTEQPAGPQRAVAISPDGRFLAAGDECHIIRVWDIASGKLVHRLKGHRGWVWSVSFSPDGKQFASGSLDRTVIVWDAQTGKAIRTLGGHSRQLSQIAFSPDGATITAGGERGEVKFWDVATGRPMPPLQVHDDYVRAVAISPDGRSLASNGPDRTTRVSELATGRLLHTFQLVNDADKASPIAVAFRPDGKAIAWTTSYKNNSLHLVDLETGKEQVLGGHLNSLGCVAYHPDDVRLLATASSDGSVRFWRQEGDEVYFRAVGPGPFGQHVNWVAFTPDGRYLATANENGNVSILKVPPAAEINLATESPPE